MSDSSSNAISNVIPDQPNNPEQFYFSVEMNGEEPIVTICPVSFFDENKFMDTDEFFDDIAEFLEKNGFFAILASSFENENDDATMESVTKKMVELGFKQNAEFDKYIAETQVDFNEFATTGPDSAGTYTSRDEENEEVSESVTGERVSRFAGMTEDTSDDEANEDKQG